MKGESQRNVLVVDDNAANIFVLSTMLKRLGFEVDEASSGMEAINLSCQKQYDVIMMDHLMPEMDGIEAIEKIRFASIDGSDNIIFGVTATVTEKITQQFLAAGANAVLEKPVTLEKLEQKLKEYHIQNAQSQEEVKETNDEDIINDLKQIDGLNYERGIQMMAGSIEHYMKILQVCVKNIADTVHMLELIQESNQLEGFVLHFHSLKGIFLNIGADGMAEKSKELEAAGKAGKIEIINENITAYIESVIQFNEKISKTTELYKEKKQGENASSNVSASEFCKNLSELKEHIENFEYIEITELLEKMTYNCHQEQREEIEKIMNCIQDFDYDKALEITDALISKSET